MTMIRVKFDDKPLRMSGGVVDIAYADTIQFFCCVFFLLAVFSTAHTRIDEQYVVVRDLGKAFIHYGLPQVCPAEALRNKPAERRLLSSRCRATGAVHWRNFSSHQSSYRSISLRPTNT